MKRSPGLEHVASLERGLRVLQTFSRTNPQMTLSQVAALASLTPATARRSLHTLERLGYVARSGRKFLLRPRVLALGAGYLSAINADVVLQPFVDDVVNEHGGSSSVTVLDDLEIVYVAHASANRPTRLSSAPGSRYPAYATSMGRALLAHQPDTRIDGYFQRATMRKLTEYTETDPAALRRILDGVRDRGFALVENELDYGLISIAVPVYGPGGRVVAAASCSDVTVKVDGSQLVEERLPTLRAAVKRIEATLASYPQLARSVVEHHELTNAR
jgi:IclR family pca regulon transcriptional regulator